MRSVCLLLLTGCLSPAARTQFLDRDADGVPWPEDCDDDDPGVGGGLAWYTDGDGDGIGGAAVASQGCASPAGAVPVQGDCDDADPAVRPGAAEAPCDGADNDCDAATLDGPASIDGVGFGSIQAAIDAAAVGATVTLCSGTFLGAVRVETDGLTIEGAGVDATTLDATGQQASAIELAAHGTTLRDLTVRGGAGSAGSASFTAMFGAGFGRVGGGVNATGATGTTRIEDVVIEDCVIEEASAYGYGGGIAGPLAGALVLVRTRLETNEADVGGGLAVSSVVTLESATISGNSARAFGGGVYLTPTASVTADSSTVIGPGNDGESGGGIALDQATWTGGSISGNAATSGGGVFLSGGTLTDASISANVALQDPVVGGGLGGGVFASWFSAEPMSTTSMSALDIADNLAEGGGGGFAAYGIDVALTDSTISNCVGPSAGGAYIALSKAIFTRVEFFGNVASAGSPDGFGGGLMYADGGVDSYGVPIPCVVPAGCGLDIVDGSFFLNSAELGAGVYAGAPMTVTGTQFAGNLAAQSGGGLLGVAATTIDGAEFADNAATESGGALTVLSSGVASLLLNTNFTSNEAAVGAAIYLQSTTLVIDGGALTDNDGTLGAVALGEGDLSDPTTLQVRPGTTFSDNDPFDVFADGGYSALVAPFSCQDPTPMPPACQ